MMATKNFPAGRKGICAVIAKLFLILTLAASPVSGQRGEDSVVLLYTPGPAGYGVAWQRPDNIVTVLHVVAGRPKILVKWKDQTVPATIKTIYQEADLALLQLQKPLGVPPLEIYQGDPPLDRPLDYWEVPDGTARVDRKETKLNAEKKAIPLRQFDNRIAQDPTVFAKALCSDGQANYPGLNTNVFKFEERNVGKSHSGSPLTYNGKIVGLVDGGQPIGGKACVWAIPAAAHFKSLSASTAIAPKQTCSSERLYGGLRKDNPLLKAGGALADVAGKLAAYDKDPFEFSDDSNDKLEMDLEYFTPFREVFATMFEDDQQYVRNLLSDESEYDEQVNLDELLEQPIKIFQEEETGATIAIPANSSFTIEKSPDKHHTLVEVTGLDSDTKMIIYVQSTKSKAEAQAAQKWFEKYIVSDGRKWVQETGEDADKDIVDDKLFNDPDEPYYNELMDRVVYDADHEVVAELYASLTIDETNFLGVAIKVSDWHNQSKEERLEYYLAEACAILADFAYY